MIYRGKLNKNKDVLCGKKKKRESFAHAKQSELIRRDNEIESFLKEKSIL